APDVLVAGGREPGGVAAEREDLGVGLCGCRVPVDVRLDEDQRAGGRVAGLPPEGEAGAAPLAEAALPGSPAPPGFRVLVHAGVARGVGADPEGRGAERRADGPPRQPARHRDGLDRFETDDPIRHGYAAARSPSALRTSSSCVFGETFGMTCTIVPSPSMMNV